MRNVYHSEIEISINLWNHYQSPLAAKDSSWPPCVSPGETEDAKAASTRSAQK